MPVLYCLPYHKNSTLWCHILKTFWFKSFTWTYLLTKLEKQTTFNSVSSSHIGYLIGYGKNNYGDKNRIKQWNNSEIQRKKAKFPKTALNLMKTYQRKWKWAAAVQYPIICKKTDFIPYRWGCTENYDYTMSMWVHRNDGQKQWKNRKKVEQHKSKDKNLKSFYREGYTGFIKNDKKTGNKKNQQIINYSNFINGGTQNWLKKTFWKNKSKKKKNLLWRLYKKR